MKPRPLRYYLNNLIAMQNKKRSYVAAPCITFSLLSASFLKEKKEPYLLENVSNLTHEFLYENLNKKILINFLVEIFIQKLMMHFQGEMVQFFHQKRDTENESLC